MADLHAQMVTDREQAIAQAKIDYERIMKEDEGKTFLDVLPAEFKTFKRSVIKRAVIEDIKSTTKYLNETGLFDKVITEIATARYMLCMIESKHHLAWKFIPLLSTFSIDFDPKYKDLPQTEKDRFWDKIEETSQQLRWLRDTYNAYLQRQRISRGEYDLRSLEDSGVPRTGRGNMCSVYTAVKGKWEKDVKDEITLFNPRSKKNIVLKVDIY
jgi:hypothetical protein